MDNYFKVRNLVIGKGIPKICIPLVGADEEELRRETKAALEAGCDLMEWRVDLFGYSDDVETVCSMLSVIREIAGDTPVLFTFRTSREGGDKHLFDDEYVELYLAAMKTGNADLFDVEYSKSSEVQKKLIEAAHKNGAYIIISSHDFEKTPSKDELVNRFSDMQALGGDIQKIAVMPGDKTDVMNLLNATFEFYNDGARTPIISMSMGKLGGISRIAGELTGSAITFATAGNASAPGQMDAGKVREILMLLTPGDETDEGGSRNKNIVLTGFMGTGKSAVSSYISKRFGYEIIDMDGTIAKREGMTISEIFASKGEEYFRDLETALLKELQARENIVISCGGGTPLREENVAEMKKNGKVFLLWASPETILERVKNSHDRPLLEGNKNVEFISGLLEKRRPKYEAAADCIIHTDGREIYKICEEIIDKIK